MAKVTAVSTNGVHLAGNLVEWDPAKFQMANYKGNGEMSGSVYQYMAYVTSGASPEYKFINGNTWGDAESVPSACVVNGNRGLSNITTDTIISNTNIISYIENKYKENKIKSKSIFASLIARHDREGQRTKICNALSKYELLQGKIMYSGDFRNNTSIKDFVKLF